MKKKYFFIGILIISLILSWCYRYSTLNSFYQTLSDRTRVVFLAEEYVDFGTDWLTKDVTAEVEVYASKDYKVYHEFDDEGLIGGKYLMSKAEGGGTSFK